MTATVDSASVSAAVTVGTLADLTITKTDDHGGDSSTATAGSVVSGTQLVYTITVSNTGPDDAPGTTVADTFPAAFTGASFTATAAGGATFANGTGSETGSGNLSDTVSLPANSSVTYTITGTVRSSATGTLSNTATLTPGPGVTDSNPVTRATDTDRLTPLADLAVALAASPSRLVVGGTITYTITVTNNGPSTSSATLTDVVPAGTSFVSASSGFAGYNPGTGTLNLGALNPGARVTGTLVFHLNAAGKVTDTASVSGSVPDPSPANNKATLTSTVLVNAGILLLNPGGGALDVAGTSSVTVTGGGAIVVNSTNPASVQESTSGSIQATELDVGGNPGVQVTGHGVLAAPVKTSQPPLADPFAGLPVPRPPAGTPPNPAFTSGNQVLQPGTYGLITVSGTASLTLLPGVYNLTRGLMVSGGGRVSGGGVLLYLGTSGGLSVQSGGQVSLSAPTSGPYQGLAIWQDRASSNPVVVNQGTLNLTGSLYAPGAAVALLNGGMLSLKGDLSHRIDAELVALQLLLPSGTVTVDASANPFAVL